MNCADIEILICDYVDGTLAADRKAAIERHLAQCPACAELARDSAAAVAFIGRVADVEPPPELITRILFDPPWSKEKTRSKGLRSRFAGWFSPILQPKFAMGMAMTILSFSILSQLAPVRQLRLSDLEPVKVWHGLEDRAGRAWDRTVKFYENLKFVYQIQTTLREWQQQDDEQHPAQKQGTSVPKTDVHKLPANSAPSGGANSPPPGGAPSTPSGGKH
jgi:hypothetical protein